MLIFNACKSPKCYGGGDLGVTFAGISNQKSYLSISNIAIFC
jgi:hypothetical protein